MIDTVILTLYRFEIVPRLQDKQASWKLQSQHGGYKKYILQYPKNSNSSYMPRVTLIERGKTQTVNIEFSVPKLIYGNNVAEVDENDWKKVVNKLQNKLRTIGIQVFTENLKQAEVSSFHPSKNVLLSKETSPKSIIKELQKINLTNKLDLNKDSFRNEGESLHCYANSHSLVIYDKIKDLNKPTKRATDKDPPPHQRALFETLKELERNQSILRIEIRLSYKRKMKEIMQKIQASSEPTFSDIFKTGVCQEIIQYYWHTIIEGDNMFLFSSDTSMQDLLERIIEQGENKTAKQAIYKLGLLTLTKDTQGIRGLRGIIDANFSGRTWYRMKDDIHSLNSLTSPPEDHWIFQVERALSEFHKIDLTGYDVYTEDKIEP